MKIRSCFVSNSSSSSFVCQFCGEIFDSDYDDEKAYVCEKGHRVCHYDVDETAIYEYARNRYDIDNITVDLFNDFLKYLHWNIDFRKEACQRETIRKDRYDNYMRMIFMHEKYVEIIEDKIKNNDMSVDGELYFDLKVFCNESRNNIHEKIPTKFCPVCKRKEEMKNIPEYDEYLRLFNKFNKITPDGTSIN